MGKKSSIIPAKEHHILQDYAQSANALFHFMKQIEYLESALLNCALIPRYCLEDIRYLNLKISDNPFNEIAVLQKCFCDIPLHKIATNVEMALTDDSAKKLKKYKLKNFSLGNSHLDCYGPFAIAFSKMWCERHDLQPVHYLNEDSNYTNNLKSLITKLLNDDNLPDEFAIDILQRLALIKPLRGKMKRQVYINNENLEIEVLKNFHDEQEWRFIPDLTRIAKPNITSDFQLIIANPKLLELQLEPTLRFIDGQSNELKDSKFHDLWINFTYNDIRYLIVPDKQSRIDIINYILNLPNINFVTTDNIQMQKEILVSKILVLSEIREDW